MRLPPRTGRLLPSAGEQLLRTQTIAFLYKNHQFINKNMIPFWTGRLLSSMFAFYHHFFIGLQQKLIKSSLISIFSTVRFHMCPQIACLRRGKVTLLHLFDFSPLCVFKCVFKLPVVEDAKSHWLHLFSFSALCVFKCVLKWPA